MKAGDIVLLPNGYYPDGKPRPRFHAKLISERDNHNGRGPAWVVKDENGRRFTMYAKTLESYLVR